MFEVFRDLLELELASTPLSGRSRLSEKDRDSE